jgi:tetraacyldisaccharide 4'-kinase
VIKEIIYPDHYQYRYKDIKEIKDLAKKMNAKIITSEKDYVKVKKFDKKNIKFLKVNLKIKNKNKLFNFIKSKFYESN